MFILTDKKLNGWSDRLRGNLEALDEQIENARTMSKPKRKEDHHTALQWAKMLRDLIELRNATLANVKAHLLGRDETGLPTEPEDYYQGNSSHVQFERDFQTFFLAPWHASDLKLQCEDCGKESEEVSARQFPHEYEADEYFDLCGRCYEKRIQTTDAEPDQASPPVEPASKHEIETLLQSAALMIRVLKTLPPNRRIAELERLLAERAHIAPGMEPALEAYVGVLQKALDDAKAEDADSKPVE